MYSRLDYFIDRLLVHSLTEVSPHNAIKFAKDDLAAEDHRQSRIERQAFDDATSHLRYGKGEGE